MSNGAPEKLTFFCELSSFDLIKLFSNQQLYTQLQLLKATISLGILDFSDERASIVQHLNKHNIPVIAWQLLSKDEGYWYNIGNASEAVSGYEKFLKWTKKHNLRWAGLGVDIEPDISEIHNLMSNRIRIIPALFKRLFRKKCFDSACKEYHSLVSRMQNDGYLVDSYEFLFMDDDRKAGSCILGRILGVTDVPSNRRVLMLYSSFFRPYGVAVLCNYACGADSVAVGITGGGVEFPGVKSVPLNWDEFSRDLRLTRRSCDDIHVFSLEGCAAQNFMEPLISFDWNLPVTQPQPLTFMLKIARVISRVILWLTAHPFLSGLVTGLLVAYILL